MGKTSKRAAKWLGILTMALTHLSILLLPFLNVPFPFFFADPFGSSAFLFIVDLFVEITEKKESMRPWVVPFFAFASFFAPLRILSSAKPFCPTINSTSFSSSGSLHFSSMVSGSETSGS